MTSLLKRDVDVDLKEGETLVIEDKQGNVIYEETEVGHNEDAWETYQILESIRNDVISAQSKLNGLLTDGDKARLNTELMDKDLKALLNEKWHSLIPQVGRKVTEFPSSSRPGLTHEVRVTPDDELVCTCEYFQYNRTCKHIDQVRMEEPRQKLGF